MTRTPEQRAPDREAGQVGARHCRTCGAALPQSGYGTREHGLGRTYCSRPCVLTGIGWPLDFDPAPLMGWNAPRRRAGGSKIQRVYDLLARQTRPVAARELAPLVVNAGICGAESVATFLSSLTRAGRARQTYPPDGPKPPQGGRPIAYYEALPASEGRN